MEQSTDHAREQRALSERLTRLEEIVRLGVQYDRERNHRAWESLQGQINYVASQIAPPAGRSPLGTLAWVKILVAILLPYLALLLTGSIQIAHRVAEIGLIP